MKPARPAGRPSGYGAPREGGAYRAPRGDREYRRRDDAGEDKEGAGAGYRPVCGMEFWYRDDLLTISDSVVLAEVLQPLRLLYKSVGYEQRQGGCYRWNWFQLSFMHLPVLERCVVAV